MKGISKIIMTIDELLKVLEGIPIDKKLVIYSISKGKTSEILSVEGDENSDIIEIHIS